jgi:surfeit locus 1 family protein
MSITRFESKFIANWRFGLLALLAALFFSKLGFWQLARAEEKSQLLIQHQSAASQQPVVWHSGDTLPLQYQPIQVHGRFSAITLMLDNQHYQHQFGYDVLSPLILDDGRVVLIDRGFVADQSGRENLPHIEIPSGTFDLKGSVYFPSEKHWALGNIFDKTTDNIVLIELIDIRIVAQFLQKSVYPFIIRMHPQASNGFVRDWPVVSMSPVRHKAYAVQWFAMALVVLCLFIGLSIKKKI